jgi:hypothetical protein
MSEIAGVNWYWGPPFERQEVLALDLELDREDRPLGPGPDIPPAHDLRDPRVLEDGDVVLGGLLGLAVEQRQGVIFCMMFDSSFGVPGADGTPLEQRSHERRPSLTGL